MARDSAGLVTRFNICLLFPKELVHIRILIGS